MSWRNGFIAVDWGTTNRRAYLLDGAGQVEDEFQDGLGLTSVPAGGFDAAASEIRARLGDRPMLLAGMVGSNRGWREAPYVACPAAARDVAAGVLWLEPGRTGIVPGVCQTHPEADVMRGEEVQVLGARALGLIAPDAMVCHPGTHNKWIALEDGRIASFRTLMTGEMFGLLGEHSILADQLGGEARAGAAFDAGMDEVLAGGDLLSGLFRIRARYVLGQGMDDAASYASGLLIGGDVRAGLRDYGRGTVALIGRPDLCALYAAALARFDRPSTTIDGAEAFIAGMHLLTEMFR